MADALDSGSSGSNPVRVQVPFSASQKPLKFKGFFILFKVHLISYYFPYGNTYGNAIYPFKKFIFLISTS